MAPAHIPLLSGGRLLLSTTDGGFLSPVIVGSEAWYNWLTDEQNRSFSFRSHLGTYTVQRERQGNGWYWYAYRKQKGKMRKAYLGKTKELTLERLNKTVARLAERDEGGNITAMSLHESEEGASLLDIDSDSSKEKFPLSATLDPSHPSDPSTIGRYHIPPPNLKFQNSPLIGREEDVAAACALLQRPEVHIVTLAGTGGVGKTRLGIQIANELMPAFDDGVCFVPLAALVDPKLVIPTIAYTLGLREAKDWSQVERLHASLRDKHLLLLLDNFEQIVSAAPEIADLVEACPWLKVLVTSRAILHVRGECVFPVKPLTLPDADHLADGESLTHYSAIALFLERIQVIKPDFKTTATSARVIAEICMRLDGLPLTIELAAARIQLLSPQALLARLEHRLQVLTSFSQDVPIRQQTLRNTLAWSYDLLTAQEQQLFRKLSIFEGGCTLEAAEELCSTTSDAATSAAFSVLDGVTSLIDKSLLHHTVQDEGELRLIMLETIREYGIERLAASGEIVAIRRTHASFYLELAEAAAARLTGAEQVKWFERLQQEHENLRAALQWFMGQKEWELALRLGNALWRFWWARGHLSEGRQVLEQALNASKEVAADVRAKAINAAGVLAGMQGDFGQSEALCRESLNLFRQQGDLQGCATSLWMLGTVVFMKSNYAEAHLLQEEALTIFREIGNSWGIAASLERLASVAADEGDFTLALSYGEEALELSRRTGDIWGIARSLDRLGLMTYTQGNLAKAGPLLTECVVQSRKVGDKRILAYALAELGYVACAGGNYTTGRERLEESVKFSVDVGDRRGMIWGLAGLGWVSFSQGDFAAARARFEESLSILRKLDYTYRSFIALCLEGLAGVVSAQYNPAWAARLWGTAETLRETDGGPAVPPILHPIYEQLIATLRTQLDEESFANAWAEGRMMTLEQVLAAQGPVTISTRALVKPVKSPIALTAREREVLRLLAAGLTSAQIAEELCISIVTVNTHIRTIYNKTGAKSRSAVTRYAIDHNLA